MRCRSVGLSENEPPFAVRENGSSGERSMVSVGGLSV